MHKYDASQRPEGSIDGVLSEIDGETIKSRGLTIISQGESGFSSMLVAHKALEAYDPAGFILKRVEPNGLAQRFDKQSYVLGAAIARNILTHELSHDDMPWVDYFDSDLVISLSGLLIRNASLSDEVVVSRLRCESPDYHDLMRDIVFSCEEALIPSNAYTVIYAEDTARGSYDYFSVVKASAKAVSSLDFNPWTVSS